MDIHEAMAYIHSTSWKGSKLGLSRMSELMSLLGNPQNKLKFVHIAGTNGKGSTAAMLSSILAESGYKTGLYTSPFINCFGERIRINGQPISDKSIIALTEQLKCCCDKLRDTPTEFEIVTAMALLHFANSNCDIVVLEVGMGGRLDATNIIETAELAVITSIGLDHTAELGNEIRQIAFEKAGIIKRDIDVILLEQDSLVMDEMQKCAAIQHAIIHMAKVGDSVSCRHDLSGQFFNYGGVNDLFLPLLGSYQLENASVVLKAVEILRRKGWNISEASVRAGLSNTQWPGRFEVVSGKPLVIVDGCHNPQGVQALVESCRQYLNGKRIIFIIGALADKDYDEMMRIASAAAHRFIVVKPDSSRALDAYKLAKVILKYHEDVTICGTVKNGLKHALSNALADDAICVFGSLYMIRDVHDYFTN